MPGPPPVVTGISPKEGVPGTKVTIRGENLGVDDADLIGLSICGIDCLLTATWHSPTKITALTGPAKNTGEIIIRTRSGGYGTCTVTFKGYLVKVGPLQETCAWVDETKTVGPSQTNRPSSPMLKGQEDPLGISNEDASKFPEHELNELFPEGSSNINDENFDPARYLLENHKGTRFDDLKNGLVFLKSKVSQKNEGPMTFVKTNISTFIDCLELLEGLHGKLEQDSEARKNCPLSQNLENILERSSQSADALFHDVLGRKDRADATRNALSVLQRFRFLFNLPCAIDRNIKKGEYDIVINDFARAKSLFGSTDVAVFKKVYGEVENRITAFRDKLHKDLLKLPSTVEEQKKIIRYLVNLEVQGDPAWTCLTNEQQWISSLMNRCKQEHLNTVVSGKQNETDLDVTVESERCVSPSMYSISISSPSLGSTPRKGSTGISRMPLKVQFVEELTKILTENFPDFWRLGLAYFSGQIFRNEKWKTDISKHAQFKQMTMELIQQFSCLIRAAFLPESIENLPAATRDECGDWPATKLDREWLPHCVRYVRSSVLALAGLELQSDCQEILRELAFDMRTHSMNTLLTQGIDDVQSLTCRETWVVEVSDENGGITQLPLLFENLINETIQHLNEVVIKIRQGESEMFNNRMVQKEAILQVTKLLQSFGTCLEELAFGPTTEKEVRKTKSGSVQHINFNTDIIPYQKRLMIVLSNCHNTIERIIPRAIDNFERHGYPEMNKVMQSVEVTYSALDNHLFECYIEEKSNPIVGALEPKMYVGRFDWKTCPKPKGVRNYIKDSLMAIIAVHSEVFSVSPSFVPRVMYRVVQAVSEEIVRLMECVTGFSNYGAVQCQLEILAFRDTVDDYLTPTARSALDDALKCPQEINIAENKRLLENLLQEFKTKFKFFTMCLKMNNPDESNA